MKKFKKMFAVLLTLAMVLGMSVTSLAAPETDPNNPDGKWGTADDKGMITVRGIEEKGENSLLQVVYYPIVKAKYENNGFFSGYEKLYDGLDMTAGQPDETTNVGAIRFSEEQLSAVLREIGSAAGTAMTPGTEDGTYTATVAAGSYLVVVKNAETNVYSPVVVSVNYVNKDGQNIVEGGAVDLEGFKDGINVSDGSAWVKIRNNPDVEKTITSKDTDNGDTDKANTLKVGDTVSYQIKVPAIPYYGGVHPVFALEDKLTGLTYKENLEVKVLGGNEDGTDKILTAGTDYFLTPAEESITDTIVINFVSKAPAAGTNGYTLNLYQGKALIVTYDATLNADANLNASSNDNDVTLTYTHDSTQTGKEDTEEDKTRTYTFDIDGGATGVNGSETTQNILNKLGEIVSSSTTPGESKRELLEGATFGLFTDADATSPYTNTAAVNGLNSDGETVAFWDGATGVSTTDENGQIQIRGLAGGAYYLKELTAPEGYSLNTQIFKIDIKAEIDDTTHELTGWKVYVNEAVISEDSKPVADFTVENDGTVEKTLVEDKDPTAPTDGFNILNTKLTDLPSTGGIGTTIFTIAGCLIMIVAAGLFFASRRKAAK